MTARSVSRAQKPFGSSKMKVKQHIPNFVDAGAYEAEVRTGAELREVDFVKTWTLDPGFYRFSVHRNYWANPRAEVEQTHLLLAELNGGAKWWVVAYLTGPDALDAIADFPDWKPKEDPEDK